jgi:hypothetical protein
LYQIYNIQTGAILLCDSTVTDKHALKGAYSVLLHQLNSSKIGFLVQFQVIFYFKRLLNRVSKLEGVNFMSI